MIPIRYQIGDTELFCIPTDRFKSEFLSFRYTLPVSAETSQQNALLTSVLKRGTEKYPTKLALNRHLDDLYSTTISTHSRRVGDMQRLGLSADFLGARYVGGGCGILPEVLDAMAEIWIRPRREHGLFCADFVEREKVVLRDAIRATINNPRGYALAECKKLLCAGEPYALPLIGTEETVDEITAATLTARYEAVLKSSSPTFFYVGAMEPERVAGLIAERFPVLHRGVTDYQSTVKRVEGEPKIGEEEMPLCQGKLSIGFRTDVTHCHPLGAAMLMLNEILGGSPASKLFLNVRERRSLCYHCSSSLDLYKGVLFANAGMKPENRAVTEEAMMQEFYDLAKGNISKTEFEAAQRSLDYSCRQLLDLPGGLVDFYDGRLLIGSDQTVDHYRTALAAVTREQVVEAAARVCHGATFFLRGTLEGEEDEE
ncbi:MAG: insulinase family protein [Clostridia bacterium]|nr:insulinase family protein [Clostridia bacterium]